MNAQAKSVAAYIRVSTNGQAEDGFGLDVQRERIAAFCASQGWTLGEVFVDAGISGATVSKRPGLRKLLAHVRKKQIDTIVVFKLDRLSRCLLDLITLLEKEFTPNDAALVSVTESLDTDSPQGRLFISILASFAEFERSLISERMSNGRKAKARSGGRASGWVFGYETKDGECRIISEEAKVVKHVFKEYMRLGSISGVVRLLKNEGISNRRGKPFSIQALSYMLRNLFYAGTVVYGDIETKGSHERIIAPSLFGKVQTNLNRSRAS